MEIKFALNISDKINKFKKVFDEFEEKIGTLIRNKEYGSDLSMIYVGWICVAPEYEPFFKIHKPKYYQNRQATIDGLGYKMVNTLEYEIKIDYTEILNSSYDDLNSILTNKLAYSLKNIVKKNKKIKDFNLDELIKNIKYNE